MPQKEEGVVCKSQYDALCIPAYFDEIRRFPPKLAVFERKSVDHESLVADCQIRHIPPDLAIQREHFVIY